MKKTLRINKNRTFFGVKCTLLAFSIILSVFVLLVNYIVPGGITDTTYTVLRVISLVIVAVVMVFEIVPYIQLSNEGIRNIYLEKDIQIEKLNKFNRLIDNNELLYKFQPIVNAKDGSIYAYESLMRTKPEVGLGPRDILRYAEISQKLYDVEYYTFYNTLKIYSENQQLFSGRKVFINSIPSITLTDEHLIKLKDKFGAAAENAVVEILEDDEDTDESLAAFTKIQQLFNCQIAIDDYGSGYSNESKLIHNNPNYIKLDISLISSIETDRKKQFLVSNIINFASKYGIKVLGEGVETKEELQMLIELGVDFVQGFYLAKPNSEIIPEIDQEIKRFIIGENIRLAKYDNAMNVYEATDNETIRLLDIALEKYTTIYVESGTVNIIGERDHAIEMIIKTARNSECVINLENANIKGSEGPSIQIGEGGKLKLNITGDNTFNKEGVRVPENSEFTLAGDGNLTVNVDRNNGVGFGGNFDDSFGSMIFASTGILEINSSGDKIISIGGGTQNENSTINLLKGRVKINGCGIRSIGIGAVNGSTSILTFASEIEININANEAVAVGAFSGYLKYVSNNNIAVKMQGEKIIGIGVIEKGRGTISLSKGKTKVDVRGAEAVGIGSPDGDIEITCSTEVVSVYGEGTNVSGIGNRNGNGKLFINSGIVKSYLLAANPNWFGTCGKNVIIIGGCVNGGENGIIDPENSFGEPVRQVIVKNQDKYAKHVITPKGDYVYRAEKPSDSTEMCIFLPMECELKDVY